MNDKIVELDTNKLIIIIVVKSKATVETEWSVPYWSTDRHERNPDPSPPPRFRPRALPPILRQLGFLLPPRPFFPTPHHSISTPTFLKI